MGRERGGRLESMKGEGEKGRGMAGEGAGKRKEGTEGGVGKGWGITHTHTCLTAIFWYYPDEPVPDR